MVFKREDIEAREQDTLAPYAAKSAETKGREYPETEDELRTAFQRDIDRIIYCLARRRLSKKTQVFFAGHGDHYRNRSSHTDEVVRIARSLARTLGLNEDLAEAIALAHDLGHPCFGHKGEQTLDELLEPHGAHFEHNEQSLWVVERLERKSENYPGLNLTFEVRDGLNKHRTPYDSPRATDSAMPTLEAQLVNVADEIAYKHHDIDDGLRAKAFTEKDLENLRLWQEAMKDVGGNIGTIRSRVIEIMINDLVQTTEGRLNELKIRTLDDVSSQKEPVARFSEAMAKMIEELGKFLEERFYKFEPVQKYNRQGEGVIHFLFKKFYDEPEKMPEEFIARLKNEPKAIIVKDYIAGMTDHFALELYDKFKK
ncbi:HD domain-containing protein [Candidatus Peregrinibacteria bacterium]|nr:HD domain-containing protein [Candidatus Peregrinibacteria bacterium]